MLSTAAHMTGCIKCTDSFTCAHTCHTEMDPAWVVKLVAAIAGTDLFVINPCHYCHLNFRLWKIHELKSLSHTPTLIPSSVQCSSEWKMKQISNPSLHFPFFSDSSWRKMIYKTKNFSSDFSNASHLFNQALHCEKHSLPLLDLKPTGAMGLVSLLFKLPSYQTKYRPDLERSASTNKSWSSAFKIRPASIQ